MSAASFAARASTPVPMYGASARSKRNRLALHVRTHQGPVCIVVLKERNECRGDRNDLLRRNVHHLDFSARHVGDLGGSTEEDILFKLSEPSRVAACGNDGQNLVGGEGASGFSGVGLSDDVFLFLVGGEVTDVSWCTTPS